MKAGEKAREKREEGWKGWSGANERGRKERRLGEKEIKTRKGYEGCSFNSSRK